MAEPGPRTLKHADPEGHGLCPPTAGGSWKWYLCHFAHKLLDFRRPEVESLASLEGCPMEQLVWREPPSTEPIMVPAWHISLPSDQVACRIASRSMLTKAMYEVWGEGSTWEEMQEAVRAYPEELKAPWLTPDLSFKVAVESYGTRLEMGKQVELIQRLDCVPFKGPVDLKAPDVTFGLLVVEVGSTLGLGEPGMVPSRVYFGRRVGAYDHIVVQRYTLKTRPYIGPTSMDTEMAFIMCNQAKVRRGCLVLDPYVGTGSVAVAAAHLGAQCMGADIDMRVIKMGKKGPKGETLDIYSNFAHYGTQGLLAGLVRLDMHRPPFRDGLEEVFHAIVGDPPYGVRAGGRKGASKELEVKVDPATHITSTDPYTLGECMRDLLDFAARMLVVGGRLVCFIPATPETYSEAGLPTHPALRLLHNSEQLLTTRYSRRLITLEKVARYDAAAAAAHHAAQPDPSMAIDRMRDLVLGPHERDAAGKPIYPEGTLNTRKYRSKML